MSDTQSVYVTPLNLMVEVAPSESSQELPQGLLPTVVVVVVVPCPLPVVDVIPDMRLVVRVVPEPSSENAEQVPMTLWIDPQIWVFRYWVLN
jgi:hypothetical protein